MHTTTCTSSGFIHPAHCPCMLPRPAALHAASAHRPCTLPLCMLSLRVAPACCPCTLSMHVVPTRCPCTLPLCAAPARCPCTRTRMLPLYAAPVCCPNMLPLHAATVCCPCTLPLHASLASRLCTLPQHAAPASCPRMKWFHTSLPTVGTLVCCTCLLCGWIWTSPADKHFIKFKLHQATEACNSKMNTQVRGTRSMR